jgi:stage V sporulation protein SpoVS
MDSINQSIKAIIVARNYVADEGLDCAISAVSVNDDVGRDALTLCVTPHAKTHDVAAAEDNFFRCAATTKHGALAGAIASRVREGAMQLSCTSVGPAAVLRSVKAFGLAKEYAEGCDFYLVPFFVQYAVGDEDRTGIRLDAFVTKSPNK